jgi:predicted nucleic acid-binding protein
MAAAGHTLDAGALIALERGDHRLQRLLLEARDRSRPISIPAGALGQVWRGSPRQALLARVLRLGAVEIIDLTGEAARAAGILCGAAGTNDVIDASVVLCAAERGHRIVTSDPDDLRRLDPSARIVAL